MFKDKLLKLKESFIVQTEGNNKKKIENLAVFVVILIITVILINTIWNGDKKKKEDVSDLSKVLAQTEITKEEKLSLNEGSDLEQSLENILQNIEGVGKTKVLLTYSESSQTLAMYNEDNTKSDTEEKDTRWR